MASGAQHIRSTLIISLPMGLSAYAISDLHGGIACLAGVLAGVILSPDLDIKTRTSSEYLVYRYMGKYLGLIWFMLWYPYSWFIPHRHPLSHWPIFGTLGRLLYLSVGASLVWAGMTWVGTGNLPAVTLLPDGLFTYTTLWGIIGLVSADILHFVMDNRYIKF